MKLNIRSDNLAKRTPIRALLDELQTEGWMHDYKTDKAGHVTHLFFAHPYQLHLTKRFHTVLVLDCTYKTNRFNMPLLGHRHRGVEKSPVQRTLSRRCGKKQFRAGSSVNRGLFWKRLWGTGQRTFCMWVQLL